MNEDVRASEVWVMRQAERLSALMLSDPTCEAMPAYVKSPDALALVMAGAWNLPCFRELAERLQARHRANEHAGLRTSACEACGWFDGAVYQARTGRQFTQDFPELFQRAAPPSEQE